MCMLIYLSLLLNLLSCDYLFGLPVMYNGLGYPPQKEYLGNKNPYYKLLHDNGNLLYPHGRDLLG